MTFNPKNAMFVVKYQPDKLSDVIGDHKIKIMEYLKEPSSIPHFLFYGTTPGVGKTLTAKLIIKELGVDYLILNSSDDRKIESVREKVKEFAMTASSKPGLRKIILLDEADGMHKLSQDALRNIMETFAKNCLFVLTANYVNRIIDPIQSRCTTIEFANPNKDEIKVHLKKICDAESMKYTDEGLDELIRINYPSIRNMVMKLQDMKIENKDIILDNVSSNVDFYAILYNTIKVEKDWKKVKEIIFQENIDVRDLNHHFWEMAVKENDLKILQVTCRNEKDMALGADDKITFVTSLLELCK